MMNASRISIDCPSCKKQRNIDEIQMGASVPTKLVDQIQQKHPNWQADMPVCDHCLRIAKADYATSMLAEENGEITELEKEVIDSFRDGDMMPTNENDEELRERTQSEVYGFCCKESEDRLFCGISRQI